MLLLRAIASSSQPEDEERHQTAVQSDLIVNSHLNTPLERIGRMLNVFANSAVVIYKICWDTIVSARSSTLVVLLNTLSPDINHAGIFMHRVF